MGGTENERVGWNDPGFGRTLPPKPARQWLGGRSSPRVDLFSGNRPVKGVS